MPPPHHPPLLLLRQVGHTTSETYVHRLGRSGRAGKSGSGLLLLSEAEGPHVLAAIRDAGKAPLKQAGPGSPITGGVKPQDPPSPELRAVYDLIAKNPTGELAGVSEGDGGALRWQRRRAPQCLAPLRSRSPPLQKRSDAYQSWLGYYRGAVATELKLNPTELVAACNRAFDCGPGGLLKVPSVSTTILTRMGLAADTPGLVVRVDREQQPVAPRQPRHQAGGSGDARRPR